MAFLALLADPRAALRPPRPDRTMAEYRRRLDAPMAAALGPRVAAVETLHIGTTDRPLQCRSYVPSQRAPGAILFFHGGGFVIGSLDTHDAMCRSLAVHSGRRVVAVDYRLAPEAPFPAATDDCRAALAWLVQEEKGRAIALVGDSAGGHLAVTAALHAAGGGIGLAALGLLYPAVDPACASASWRTFGNGYILTREWMRWAWAAYRADTDPADPAIALLRADLSDLPPTLIVTAACDPLRDEGEALGSAIVAAGGEAIVHRATGMIHGFASLPTLTPAADDTVRLMARHLCQHMR